MAPFLSICRCIFGTLLKNTAQQYCMSFSWEFLSMGFCLVFLYACWNDLFWNQVYTHINSLISLLVVFWIPKWHCYSFQSFFYFFLLNQALLYYLESNVGKPNLPLFHLSEIETVMPIQNFWKVGWIGLGSWCPPLSLCFSSLHF